MDVLLVGGKNYVKASVIARELGYTADYVGQLCRAKKVNAKLVGRSWYVERDSIHGHKKTRYRSTQGSTKKELSSLLRIRNDEPVTVSNFYTHHERAKGPEYTKDSSELIPEVSKYPVKGRIPVELADAKALKVESKSASYTFERPVLPQIKFTGTVKVTDAGTSEDPEIPTNGALIHPKEVAALRSEKNHKNIDISDDLENEETDPIAAPKVSVTSANRVSKVPVMEVDDQAEEADQNSTETSRNPLFLIVALSIAFILGCAISVLLFGLEADGSYVSSGMVMWSYKLVDLQKLLHLFSSLLQLL